MAVLNKFAFGFQTIDIQIVLSKYIAEQQRTATENFKYSRRHKLTKKIKYDTRFYLEPDLNFEKLIRLVLERLLFVPYEDAKDLLISHKNCTF